GPRPMVEEIPQLVPESIWDVERLVRCELIDTLRCRDSDHGRRYAGVAGRELQGDRGQRNLEAVAERAQSRRSGEDLLARTSVLIVRPRVQGLRKHAARVGCGVDEGRPGVENIIDEAVRGLIKQRVPAVVEHDVEDAR